MKYVAIFHGNLNYAYLTSDKYEFVIRTSYELIFDTMREDFPGTKYVFEASGYTLEQIATLCPDVLEKLKAAIKSGECEFMGSPYAHPMLPNFPEEDGVWSIKFSNEAYQKYLGFVPKSFWNPECGWRHYIPRQVLKCGYENLIGDFEAYSRSRGKDGRPLRPEIYEKEFSKEKLFYNFAFKYDLPGAEKAIHFPFENIEGAPKGKLRMFLRTDRVAQFAVRFFMGMEGYSFDKYIGLIKKYSQQPKGETEGALIIFADDAEYIGTNGWFRLKYQNKPDNVFEATPKSRQNLIDLITECKKMGGFVTFNDACSKLPVRPDRLDFEDDSAWHGARASTWASTPMARLLRPWQDLVRRKLNTQGAKMDPETMKKAWYHLTNSYNSDGQWPPTLPQAPHIIHPFNYGYCFDNLLKAEMLVGGVDRGKLDTDPLETVRETLSLQQKLILEKSKLLIKSNKPADQKAGKAAKDLVKKSQDVTSIRSSSSTILYADEYKARADFLVEARRMVGGVVLEKVDMTPQT